MNKSSLINGAGLTMVRVTHAKRILAFRDGKIRKDDSMASRPRANEVLKTLPILED
jgi:hypothetical protein